MLWGGSSSHIAFFGRIVNSFGFGSALNFIKKSSPQAFHFSPSRNFEASLPHRLSRSPPSFSILNNAKIQTVSRIATRWSRERNIWARRDAGMWAAYRWPTRWKDGTNLSSLNGCRQNQRRAHKSWDVDRTGFPIKTILSLDPRGSCLGTIWLSSLAPADCLSYLLPKTNPLFVSYSYARVRSYRMWHPTQNWAEILLEDGGHSRVRGRAT